MLKLPRRPGSSNGLDTSAPQPSESLEEPGHLRDTGLPFKAAFSFVESALRIDIAKRSEIVLSLTFRKDKARIRASADHQRIVQKSGPGFPSLTMRSSRML